MLKKLFVAVLITLLAFVAYPVFSAGYSDGFEAATLDPFWNHTTLSGSSITSDIYRTGMNSLKIDSANETYETYIGHDLVSPINGSVSVWFYDTGAKINAGAIIFDSFGMPISISINPYDAEYQVLFFGPSGIQRSEGWHEFKFIADGTKCVVFIDGTNITESPFLLDINSFALFQNTWPGDPEGAVYFDDFRYQTLDGIYINAPEDITIEASSPSGTPVNLGTPEIGGTSDPNPAITNDAPELFQIGTTDVVWTVTDSVTGESATDTQKVTVVDTTAPEFVSLTVDPNTLWSPNHKMNNINVTALVTDNGDAAPACKIISITSNESDNAIGDGNSSNDIVITGDMTAQLRAERSGKGTGRIYKITVECTDASGNSSTATVNVTVPKSK